MCDRFALIDRTIVPNLQTLSAVMNASMDDLARCPGIGERKVFYDLSSQVVEDVESLSSQVNNGWEFGIHF